MIQGAKGGEKMGVPFVVFTLLKILVIIFVLLTGVAYLVWFERKLIARMQSRLGPTRVGFHGLLQPLADAVKLLTKEDFTPAAAYRLTYLVAPCISMIVAFLAFAVIPFGPVMTIKGRE